LSEFLVELRVGHGDEIRHTGYWSLALRLCAGRDRARGRDSRGHVGVVERIPRRKGVRVRGASKGRLERRRRGFFLRSGAERRIGRGSVDPLSLRVKGFRSRAV
jgi:hypothetical protein